MNCQITFGYITLDNDSCMNQRTIHGSPGKLSTACERCLQIVIKPDRTSTRVIALPPEGETIRPSRCGIDVLGSRIYFIVKVYDSIISDGLSLSRIMLSCKLAKTFFDKASKIPSCYIVSTLIQRSMA